jgi:hypothetical protein
MYKYIFSAIGAVIIIKGFSKKYTITNKHIIPIKQDNPHIEDSFSSSKTD